MEAPGVQTAIFLMPRSSSSWKGAAALWVTVGGWALAAEKILGNAIVVTTDRIAKPLEVLDYPLQRKEVVREKKKIRRFSFPFLRLFFKDLLLLMRSCQRIETGSLPDRGAVQFVWEQHDLFAGQGKALSLQYGVPFIKYVHAPVVWEASKWGVKRYLWGKILERFEVVSLKKADIVLAVSLAVKEKLIEMGIEEKKIVVSPMGVSPELFEEKDRNISSIKAQYKLENKIIIGWIGSFREFHGIDQVITAFAQVSDHFPAVRLVLVGSGSERKGAEELAVRLNVQDRVIFTGNQKYCKIPDFVAMFDLAVVSAKSSEGFHYSPLKLREYMAAGKAVIAPRAGEIAEKFKDNEEVKLFSPGNIPDLVMAMEDLISDENKRSFLGSQGKKAILKTGTWEAELKKLLFHLEKSKV